MNAFVQTLTKFFNDEKGISAIEYGFIAGLIAISIIVGAGLLGVTLNNIFTDIAPNITGP